jgi:transcriptional regulator with XRE-family HTH domain
MLHTEDFINRLEFIMEHYGLSASSFADKVGVQRSSISHLLSGRNKPSLDFVMKVLDIYPELNLYWLLNGSGTYLKNDVVDNSEKKAQTAPAPIIENTAGKVNTLFSDENFTESNKEPLVSNSNLFAEKSGGKNIEKIVLFYSDGTFEDYKPSGSK